MANIPAELKYSNDHEWCRVEGEYAYVGITSVTIPDPSRRTCLLIGAQTGWFLTLFRWIAPRAAPTSTTTLI